MYENKILYGLDKIHICGLDGVIRPILGALDIEINLEQEYQYAKNRGYDVFRLDGAIKGVGKLTALNLTLEEQSWLFGYKYKNGELSVGGQFSPQPISLLFARKKADKCEIYTVAYKCIFKNPNISGKTRQKEMEEDTLTLEFDVLRDMKKQLTYFSLDTKLANKDKVDNFFKEIQIPSE
jgi:phi13 family phage major tail protein